MTRNVKGILFVDYVRMLRTRKDVDWSRFLHPTDQLYLAQRIESNGWYPMPAFERMGLAILAEVAFGDLSLVREFGRASIGWLQQAYIDLIKPGDPLESLMRFQVLRQSFFDFPALEVHSVNDGESSIDISYHMSALAEEAASHQTLGFFQGLLEFSGASEVQSGFKTRSWAGDPVTNIQLSWK